MIWSNREEVLMSDQAFVVMQIGEKGTPERKRADEIYNFVIVPALKQFDILPYRADLDPSPGAITQKMLSELVGASLVIADLTGRNPNVFYELGIAHSFGKPLISIADAVSSLPFDAKDERVIELGEYSAAGLTYAQGESAKASLVESLEVVIAEGYMPPSPLKEIAASRSVDQLAPENPLAAEMSQIRETVEEIRRRVGPSRIVPRSVSADIKALRSVVSRNRNLLDSKDIEMLTTEHTSNGQDIWAKELAKEIGEVETPTEGAAGASSASPTDPWGSAAPASDPWAPVPSPKGAVYEEPPF